MGLFEASSARGGVIGQQRSDDGGAGYGQRSARRPDMQRFDVPSMTHLFMLGVFRDFLSGKAS
jgi:hypothetical protein